MKSLSRDPFNRAKTLWNETDEMKTNVFDDSEEWISRSARFFLIERRDWCGKDVPRLNTKLVWSGQRKIEPKYDMAHSSIHLYACTA